MQYDEDGPEMPFVKWFSTSWTSTIARATWDSQTQWHA